MRRAPKRLRLTLVATAAFLIVAVGLWWNEHATRVRMYEWVRAAESAGVEFIDVVDLAPDFGAPPEPLVERTRRLLVARKRVLISIVTEQDAKALLRAPAGGPPKLRIYRGVDLDAVLVQMIQDRFPGAEIRESTFMF